MSTTTALTIAYRCNKCWQMTCADSEQVGQEVPCVSCGTPVPVPEATPDRIKAGEEFTPVEDSASATMGMMEENLTDKEIFRIANEKVKAESKANKDVRKIASRWRRFGGAVVDTIAMMMSIGGGALLTSICCPEPNAASVIMFLTLPMMLGISQIFFIVTEGRTVGKYAVRIKIINQLGNPPGFLQGIVLRQFAVAILGLIPFFSLVNILWIFGNNENRCLHDFIAGTTVIEA